MVVLTQDQPLGCYESHKKLVPLVNLRSSTLFQVVRFQQIITKSKPSTEEEKEEGKLLKNSLVAGKNGARFFLSNLIQIKNAQNQD